ncbi:histidinol-phosphate transaminase [Candidatus Mycalebacterium sp.]
MAIEAVNSFSSQIHLYPDGDCSRLKERLSAKLGVTPQNLAVGNGSNEVLDLIAKVFLGPGDEAIYGAHGFVVYPIVTAGAGAKGIVSPMPGLNHDLKDFVRRITPETKVIFLANPNNPTGTIFSRAEFEDFLGKVPEHVAIVIDEAYFEYVDDPEYPDTLGYHSQREGLITVRTFSKIYGLAGTRIGYAIASGRVAALLNRAKEPFNVNSVSQAAALAALEDSRHCAVSRKVNLEGLEYLHSSLDSMGVERTDSKANFVLAGVGSDAAGIYEKLLREGIIVRPVSAYGLENHIRVTVGTAEHNAAFINALGEAMGK